MLIKIFTVLFYDSANIFIIYLSGRINLKLDCLVRSKKHLARFRLDIDHFVSVKVRI